MNQRPSVFSFRPGSLKVYAWALLPNHFHLLCRTGKMPLARSMRRLLTGYVVKFNRRHHRYGHLFQNWYKSIVCQEDSYLMELVRYIHLNLLRVGMVKGLGYSGAEVARYLGVSGFCVTRIVAERELPEEVRLRYENR